MLKIVGDINFSDGFFDTGFGVGTSISSGKNPFFKLNRKAEDFWIGNFECVCSNTSCHSGIHSTQFRISPKSMDAVEHLNLYGVANNHVMQHGPEAFNQMINYLKIKGILYAGTKEKPSEVFEHQGKKVSVTIFNQRPENFSKDPLYWAMPEYKSLKDELEKFNDCDFRIVYVHWGIEFINYPYIDQKQFAHYMVDSGADLVIGMHPHVLQGFEVYKGKHIFYSLGNCVFNMPWIPTSYSILVNVDLEREEVTYQYLRIEKDFFPSYVEAVPKQYSIEYLNSLLNICEDNEKYFMKVQYRMSQYRKANRKEIIKNMFKLKMDAISSICSDFVKRKLTNRLCIL